MSRDPRAVGDADVDPVGVDPAGEDPDRPADGQPSAVDVGRLPGPGGGSGGPGEVVGGAGQEPPPSGDDGDARPAERSGGGSFLRELPVLVVVALLLALLIKAFLVQAFYIPSGSMERTLLIGDRVLVNKLVYRFRDVRRGEIVVFDGRASSFQPEVFIPEPTNPLENALRGVQGALGLGASGERDFIKRVIGLPGDVVLCCDEQGRLSVNGQVLDEPYLHEDDMRPFGPVLVPEGRIFVLGDHRGASQDSRAYLASPDSGTVSLDRVIGRAFVVVWPLGDARFLQRPDTFDEVPDAAAAAPAVPEPGAEAALTAAPLLLGAVAAVPARAVGRRAALGARRGPARGPRAA